MKTNAWLNSVRCLTPYQSPLSFARSRNPDVLMFRLAGVTALLRMECDFSGLLAWSLLMWFSVSVCSTAVVAARTVSFSFVSFAFLQKTPLFSPPPPPSFVCYPGVCVCVHMCYILFNNKHCAVLFTSSCSHFCLFIRLLLLLKSGLEPTERRARCPLRRP